MAKGTESKNVIFTKLQEVYPDAFWEEQGKILRVPLTENGTRVEIKVTLTAAKTNLGDSDAPASAFSNEVEPLTPSREVTESSSIEPSEEEKENVAKLIASLGL